MAKLTLFLILACFTSCGTASVGLYPGCVDPTEADMYTCDGVSCSPRHRSVPIRTCFNLENLALADYPDNVRDSFHRAIYIINSQTCDFLAEPLDTCTGCTDCVRLGYNKRPEFAGHAWWNMHIEGDKCIISNANATIVDNSDIEKYTYTAVHEILHTLGFKHDDVGVMFPTTANSGVILPEDLDLMVSLYCAGEK